MGYSPQGSKRIRHHESNLAMPTGKTTKPFKYDLNQITFDYTVEMTNRFKELDLIDREPEELRMEIHNTVQEAAIKTISKKKKCKNQNGCLRRPYK